MYNPSREDIEQLLEGIKKGLYQKEILDVFEKMEKVVNNSPDADLKDKILFMFSGAVDLTFITICQRYNYIPTKLEKLFFYSTLHLKATMPIIDELVKVLETETKISDSSIDESGNLKLNN